jgi:hypothetical protein
MKTYKENPRQKIKPPSSETPEVSKLHMSIEKPRPDPTVQAAARSLLFSWKVAVAVICGLALGYLFVWAWGWVQGKNSQGQTPEGLAAMQDSAEPLRTGPWGNLEALPIFIEPPDEYLPIDSMVRADRRWRFTGFNTTQLLALFQSADLASDQRAELSDTSRWQFDSKAIYVNPSKDLVLNLSPSARKLIYEPMIMDPGSLFNRQYEAYRADRFDDYFANSGLPSETVGLIKKLSFPYGKLVIFCDLQVVLDTLSQPEQKTRFVKTLLRKPTMLLRLHITPDSDINELEHYWIKAGQGLDLHPMMESLAKLPRGARIDLVNMLPPIPSSDIYTYAFPSLDPKAQLKDCRWTALNFFKYVPDDRFTDSEVVRQTLLTDYYPVMSDLRYGDLVTLSKPDGTIVHVAVYLAADVVYTKNSGNFLDPFMLMSVSDMVDHFSSLIPEDQSLQIQAFRSKYY